MGGAAVTGAQTAGTAPVPNSPVYVAGIDGSGKIQPLLVGSDGSLTPQSVSTNQTIYASAARTSDPVVVDQTNANCSGIAVVINVTAVTSSPSVVFTIQGKDNLGILYPLLVSAAIVGTGTTTLQVYPGLTAAANTKANGLVPRTWNIKAVHGNSDSITYTVTASLIP